MPPCLSNWLLTSLVYNAKKKKKLLFLLTKSDVIFSLGTRSRPLNLGTTTTNIVLSATCAPWQYGLCSGHYQNRNSTSEKLKQEPEERLSWNTMSPSPKLPNCSNFRKKKLPKAFFVLSTKLLAVGWGLDLRRRLCGMSKDWIHHCSFNYFSISLQIIQLCWQKLPYILLFKLQVWYRNGWTKCVCAQDFQEIPARL